MKEYTKEERRMWVEEVKMLYKQVRLHLDDYTINFIGNMLRVKPNVFSPFYFKNTEWYALLLPEIIGNSDFLEIGTGTGAIAIHCKLMGANVTATDINADAIFCAEKNFIDLGLKIPLYIGDVYDAVPQNEKFDYIFWNHPFNNSEQQITDSLMAAGFDYDYNALKKYIKNASNFLKNPNTGLLLGTGGQADLKSVIQIAEENNYKMNLISYIEMNLGKNTEAPNDFRIYELTKY